MKKISCIICAFNEEKRIGIVLAALKNHPNIDEVIVVDDGSTDKTKEVAGSFAFVKLVSYTKNKGKSSAMAIGIEMAKNNILMFLDADIINITLEDITELAKPVLDGMTDVSMSLRKNSLWIYKKIGLDFVSGERVILKKYLQNQVEEIAKLPGFGVEVFMNRIIIKNNLRVRVVRWKNVSVTRKTSKVGFWKGVIGEILMIKETRQVISFREMLSQSYNLLKLAKKIDE